MKKLSLSMMIIGICVIASCTKNTLNHNNTPGTLTFSVGTTNYSYTAPNDMVAYYISGVNTNQVAANDPSNASNIFTLTIGGLSGTLQFLNNNYTNISYQLGSKTYVTTDSVVTQGNGSVTLNINGANATATFNTILYNKTNPLDSLIITNGNYTGPYL